MDAIRIVGQTPVYLYCQLLNHPNEPAFRVPLDGFEDKRNETLVMASLPRLPSRRQ